MTNTSQSNKNIAKNTMFLYFRMGIIMLVQLYTSRIVLNALGVKDYGIYNIVGSIIVAFNFISIPLSNATQRFYNYELGRNNIVNVNKIFNLSLIIYGLIVIILICIVEICGQWFIYNKMLLPVTRMDAALWAFHCSVFAFAISLLRTPFESLIIAYEKMSVYAYIGIVDAILKLLNAFSLMYIMTDKLKLYAINQFVIAVIGFLIIFIYNRNKFGYIKIKRVYDKEMFKNLISFSGWSIFGSIAVMLSNQGLNVLLNIFYGVAVNAAMGIATQVNTSIQQFVGNFQVAFRPQIVKQYSSNQLSSLRNLVINSSKYSFLLLFCIVCPLSFNISFILKVWLGNVPEYASEFCVLMMIYALSESLSAPMWMTIQATGKIKKYQIIISSVMVMNIVFSYIFLNIGFRPVIVLIIKCCLDLCYLIIRLSFIKKMIKFSIQEYIIKVFIPLSVIVLLTSTSILIVHHYMNEGWLRIFISIIVFGIVFIPSTYYICLNQKEKIMIKNFIINRLIQHKKNG